MIMAHSNRFIHSTAQHDGVDYVPDEIHYLVCCKFIPRRDGSKSCYCNRRERFHKKSVGTYKGKKNQLDKILNVKWDKEIHTQWESVHALGQLQNNAFYLRVNPDIDLTTIQKFLFDHWKLFEPKLIISIIGGAREYILDDRLEAKFVNGIVNVAVRSDTWIITNGYNNGLVQLVGQAIHKTKIRDSKNKTLALAISKWGGAKNIEQFIKQEGTASNRGIQLDTSDTSDDDDDDQAEVRKRKQYELNLNHTHYLMLDDGIHQNVDTEQYRTMLCDRIIQLSAEQNSHISTVTIVVGGGDATISNIYHDLRANIPVVIIEGTGRVADFFSRWLIYTSEMDHKSKEDIIYGIEELKDQPSAEPFSKTSQKFNQITTTQLLLHVSNLDLGSKILYHDKFSKYQKQLENDLKTLLASNKKSNVSTHPASNKNAKEADDKPIRLCEEVMYCLQPSVRRNISVFNLNSENDLSRTIFRSIAQSFERSWQKKKKQNESKDHIHEMNELLELTMNWDCVDLAKDFVFENSLKTISGEKLHEIFFKALKKDLFTFVYEFLRLGIKPENIFFPNDIFIDHQEKAEPRYEELINHLYDETRMNEATNHLSYFVEKCTASQTRRIESIGDLNAVLRGLIGDYMYKLYFNTMTEEDQYRLKRGLTRKTIDKRSNRPPEIESISSFTQDEKKQMASDYIMRDLFLWSVLTNRVDMAKVFLSYMKYRICPSLIATTIFKKYAQKASHGELKDSYTKSVQYFEQYAINCLDKANDHDAAKACEIVLQQNELYGFVTCLQVAAHAKDQNFVAAPACVEAMNNIWYDKLHPNQTRKRDKLALVVGFLSFGLLAPFFVSYRENEQTVIGETPRPTLKSSGINYCDPYALEFPRFSKSNPDINHFFHTLKHFHESPTLKFFYHVIFYLFFLLLFSYVLLFDFHRPTNQIPSIHWTEILTIIFVSFILIEEIHYLCSQDNIRVRKKFLSYFQDILKLIRLSAIILFYIGLIVRFTNANSESDFVAARIIMAIDIELWWLDSLSFIMAVKFLGPQLVAIAYMLKDLLFFVGVIGVVMIGYGVATRSMVYYPSINGFTTESDGSINPSFDGRSIFRQVIAPVYFFLYGEIGDELDNLDSNRDAGWSIATHVVFAFHMLFVNILLVNLLIAMFSKRFERVYEETRNIWHSQQYLFTREYYTRAPLFPPFSFLYNVYRLCRIIFFFIRRTVFKKSADRNVVVFRMIPEDRKLHKRWYEFEAASTYEYAHEQVRATLAALTKALVEPNLLSTENQEDIIRSQEDSDNIAESVKQVKQNTRRLTVSLEELLERLSNSADSEKKDKLPVA